VTKGNLIGVLMMVALLASPLLHGHLGVNSIELVFAGAIALFFWQRYGRKRFGTAYAGLRNGESRTLRGVDITAFFHPLDRSEESQKLRKDPIERLVGNSTVELRIDDVTPPEADRALAAAWLGWRAADGDALPLELSLEESSLVARGRDVSLSHNRGDQERRLGAVVEIAVLLRTLSRGEGLLRWAAGNSDPAIRLLAAHRIDPISMRVGIIEDPSATRETLDWAIRGLIPQVAGHPEVAQPLALGWMERFEMWVVEAGLRIAATQGGALRPQVMAAAEVLCASAGVDSELAEELRFALVAATRALDEESQEGLLEILRLRDPMVVAAAARRLGEVGDVRAVLPLQAALERFKLWGWSSEKAARAHGLHGDVQAAVARIQGRLTNAEAGAFALSETGGAAGSVSIADPEVGALSLDAAAESTEGQGSKNPALARKSTQKSKG